MWCSWDTFSSTLTLKTFYVFSWPSVSTHPLSYLAFHYDFILFLILVHLISFEFLSWIPILALVIWISEFSHNYFCFCNFAYFLMSQSFFNLKWHPGQTNKCKITNKSSLSVKWNFSIFGVTFLLLQVLPLCPKYT